jgi:hypothetical protein
LIITVRLIKKLHKNNAMTEPSTGAELPESRWLVEIGSSAGAEHSGAAG